MTAAGGSGESVRFNRWSVAPVLILGMAGLLVAYFDLGTNLPLSDEWIYRWEIGKLVGGQGLRLWPAASALDLVQILVSAPIAIVSSEPRFLRLAVLPFFGLAGLMSFLLARRLGAGREWAAIGAATTLCAPITLSVATSILSDIVYLALLLTGAWFAVDWIRTGRHAYGIVALTFVASLQRQHGVTLAIALTLGLIMARRQRRVGAADWRWLSAVWFAALLALALPFITGLASAQMAQAVHGGRFQLAQVVAALVELGPLLGLFLLPLGPGLVVRRRTELQRVGRVEMLPVILGLIGLVAASVFVLHFGTMIWPGNVFGIWGLGPTYMAGTKAGLVPYPLFLLVELAATLTFIVVLIWRRRAWAPSALRAEGVFIAVLALVHVAPMVLTVPLDRYYIPVAGVAAPLLVALISVAEREHHRAFRMARVWAVAVMVLGVGFYAVAQQDYEAWQSARDQAARRAFVAIPAPRLEAGYEANSVYVAVGQQERLGTTHLSWLDYGPLVPEATLLFSSVDDPRPGVTWHSAAPGRIVIACATDADPCRSALARIASAP